MLTGIARSITRKLLDGEKLWATRDYPHPWHWVMEDPGEIGLKHFQPGFVAGLVENGVGTVREQPRVGRTEQAVFVVDRAGAERALAERRDSDDPLQLNWIPEDHAALAKQSKSRAKGAK